MRKKNHLLTVMALMAGLGLFLCCCDDCPTCPNPPGPPPLGHYRVYAFDPLNQFIMSMDTPADTIVDSIRVDYSGYGLFLTPDGNRLLVTNTDERVMEIYNTVDLSYLGSTPQYGDYFFDGTENIGICLHFPGKNIRFIDPATLAPLDSISRLAWNGYIDTISKLFFASNGSRLYVIDYRQRAIVDSVALRDQRTDEPITIYRFAYNWRTSEFFCHGGAYGSAFYRYDLEGDSVMGATALRAPFGPVAISPNGEYVYMADGGDGVHDVTPIGMIYAFKAKPYALDFAISPYVWGSGPIYYPYYGDMVIAPDGRRAYLSGNSNSMGGVPLYAVDLWARKVINKIEPIPSFSAAGAAIGRVPQE